MSEPEEETQDVEPEEKEYLLTKKYIRQEKQPKKMRVLAVSGYSVLFILVLLSFCTLPVLFDRYTLVRLQAESILVNHELREQMIDTALVLRHTNRNIRASLPADKVFSEYGRVLNTTKNTLARYLEVSERLSKLGIVYQKTLPLWLVDAEVPYFRKIETREIGATLQFMTACSNLQNVPLSSFDFFIILDM